MQFIIPSKCFVKISWQEATSDFTVLGIVLLCNYVPPSPNVNLYLWRKQKKRVVGIQAHCLLLLLARAGEIRLFNVTWVDHSSLLTIVLSKLSISYSWLLLGWRLGSCHRDKGQVDHLETW